MRPFTDLQHFIYYNILNHLISKLVDIQQKTCHIRICSRTYVEMKQTTTCVSFRYKQCMDSMFSRWYNFQQASMLKVH